jgi:hypothetical protein
MKYESVRYPAMRAEVVHSLTPLADPELQRRYWTETRFPSPGFYQDLTSMINRLYDDTMVLPEPAKELESVLRSEAEVEALDSLNEVLEPPLNKLGESPDEQYMSDPEGHRSFTERLGPLALMTET